MRFTFSVTSLALSFIVTNAQQPAAQQQKPTSNNDDLKPIAVSVASRRVPAEERPISDPGA